MLCVLGSTSGDLWRFLENGLGTENWYHCHDDPPRGKVKGKRPRCWSQIWSKFYQLLCWPNSIYQTSFKWRGRINNSIYQSSLNWGGNIYRQDKLEIQIVPVVTMFFLHVDQVWPVLAAPWGRDLRGDAGSPGGRHWAVDLHHPHLPYIQGKSTVVTMLTNILKIEVTK